MRIGLVKKGVLDKSRLQKDRDPLSKDADPYELRRVPSKGPAEGVRQSWHLANMNGDCCHIFDFP